MKVILSLLLVLVSSACVFAQEKNEDFELGQNCENAIPLSLEDESFLTPTALSVIGFDCKKSALEQFNRDLNLTWYSFRAPTDMILGFEVTPLEHKDNLDFLLFRANSKKHCSQIYDASIKPIRKGLSPSACDENLTVGLSTEGSMYNFSEPVQAKKGDRFTLVINNVFGTGGHHIRLKHFKKNLVSGKITDKEGKPIIANVFWTNQVMEQVVRETETDSSGNFSVKAIVDQTDFEFSDYELIVSAKDYYLADTVLKEADLKEIKLQLEALPNNGTSSDLEKHIYFKPNSSDKIYDFSRQRLEDLYKELKFNNEIKVQLEGHSNGVFPSTEVDSKLSYLRAQSIKDYLVKKGIEQHRIFVKAFGSKKQLFPKAKSKEEESRNRRVEIRYIDI